MKNLTIVAVDTSYKALTAKAIDQTLAVTKAEKVLVLSDTDFYPGSDWVEIEPINQREYSRIVFKELTPFIETDHFMVIQYDGMPIDETYWDEDYLKFDYIGAPWPWGPIDRRNGNGGFSLRHRKIAELCADPKLEWDPEGYGDNNYMEDIHICNMYRDYLISQGVVFAPYQLAKKFSAEIPGGKYPTYGFHGTLCLPYYLSDEHMTFYIDNLLDSQFHSEVQTRLIFGLYLAERYDHVEQMMDRATNIIPDFKEKLLVQVTKEKDYFPNLYADEIESLLVNY